MHPESKQNRPNVEPSRQIGDAFSQDPPNGMVYLLREILGLHGVCVGPSIANLEMHSFVRGKIHVLGRAIKEIFNNLDIDSEQLNLINKVGKLPGQM